MIYSDPNGQKTWCAYCTHTQLRESDVKHYLLILHSLYHFSGRILWTREPTQCLFWAYCLSLTIDCGSSWKKRSCKHPLAVVCSPLRGATSLDGLCANLFSYFLSGNLMECHALVNPCPAELFQIIFRHLKLELLTQYPASNDEKYFHLWKINICQIEIFD